MKISTDRNLQDIILVDHGEDIGSEMLPVFIEVVATDGPVTAQRRDAVLDIAKSARFQNSRSLRPTLERSHAAFKETVAELAWHSFVWSAAEPKHLVVLARSQEKVAAPSTNPERA